VPGGEKWGVPRHITLSIFVAKDG
jgi:hypothetical protein